MSSPAVHALGPQVGWQPRPLRPDGQPHQRIHGRHPRFRGVLGTIDSLCPDTWRLKDATDGLGLDAYDVRTGLSHGWAGFSFGPDAKSVAPIIERQILGQ